MAENNEAKSILLEANEIMQLSVRKNDSKEGDYVAYFDSNGPQVPMIRALMKTCKQFGMICLPADVLEGIPAIAAICCVGPSPFEESEEGDAKGEDSGNKEE